VGDERMDDGERVERHNALARSAVPGVTTRPYGEVPGCVLDHVHLDLGFVTVTPHPPIEREVP
jgi:hypothetical protein